jgi:probable F420-dependent oxidoreductase
VPPADRPFRFLVQCSSPAAVDLASWRELARRCEGLGYAAMTVSDHLDEQVGPIAALTAAATATTTLRLGAMVFCNDYRHPVVLAKEAATVDALSGGRLELGLGAGWMIADYERAGLTLDPPGQRIERLGEAITVLKRLFADEACTFAGRHYRVTGLDGTPKPVQRPHPPFVIGGGGKRMLSLAAREADTVAINIDMRKGVIDADAGADATVAATERKLGWIRHAAGDRWDRIELEVRVQLVVVTDDRHGVADQLAGGFGLTPAEALASPHALCGTPSQIADDLIERRERFGISAVGVPLDALDQLAPVVAKLAGT